MSLLVLLALSASLYGVSEALYNKGGAVTVLDPSNFKDSLQTGAWMVEFYAPWCGHCKNLKPEWDKAAQALKGIVNVAAVDCDAHKAIAGEYGVRGFPTIKFMYSEGGKIKKVDYEGGRTAKDIVSFAMEKAKALALKRIGEKPSKASGSSRGAAGGSGGGKDGFYSADSGVINVGEDEFDEVLNDKAGYFVEFFAPWCGHCKNLKPEYIEAAQQLKGKVKFAAVDCDVEKSLCSKYGIGGFPTIKFFGANKKKPLEYQGGRDAASMKAFGLEQWARNAPAPEVRELTDASVWDKHCTGGEDGPKKLCFIAFLPDILDSQAAGRNAYLKTIKKAAEHHKALVDYSYFWTQGGSQPALEANVDVGGFGYPAFVAFSPKHQSCAFPRFLPPPVPAFTQCVSFEPDFAVLNCHEGFRYHLLKGALEVAPLKEFIGSLRTAGIKITGDLASIETRPAWDGKDAVIEEEAEYDLADLMNEEL